MKKLLVIFAAVITALFADVASLRADNVRGIYDRYASVSGAESVSLGRFWINLAKLVVAFGTEGDSLASEDARLAINTLSHLDAVRVLDLSGCNPETIAKFNADVDSVEVAGYELLTRMKDGGEDVVFYYKSPDRKHVEEFLMLEATRRVSGTESSVTGFPVTSCSAIQFEADGLTIQDIAAIAAEMASEPDASESDLS